MYFMECVGDVALADKTALTIFMVC